MAGHWELINDDLYWFDPDEIMVPMDAMDDRDWEDAMA
jgi:hypothetical protein